MRSIGYLFVIGVLSSYPASRGSTVATSSGDEADKMVAVSFARLQQINFKKIKRPRFFGARLLKPYQALGAALKGIVVKVDQHDASWAWKHFKFKRKGSAKKGYTLNVYALLRKLHFFDPECSPPLNRQEDWPPKLLIRLDTTLADSLRIPKFQTLVHLFEFEGVLEEVLGTYYYACYRKPELDPTHKDHERQETEANWQDLLDHGIRDNTVQQDPEEDLIDACEILIPKPYVVSQAPSVPFLATIVILPASLMAVLGKMQQRETEVKNKAHKKQSKAKSCITRL